MMNEQTVYIVLRWACKPVIAHDYLCCKVPVWHSTITAMPIFYTLKDILSARLATEKERRLYYDYHSGV